MTTAMTKAATVEQMIRTHASEFSEGLADAVDMDRLLRVSMSQIRGNTKLGKCSPASLASSILAAGKLGLEPGLLGQAYLVPYGSECTMIIGYRGLIDLARRSGQIAKIEARLVYENDEFAVTFGTDEVFVHAPLMFGDRGEVIGVYAEAYYVGGVVQREFMTLDEVNAIRDRSRAATNGPWKTDWAEMARKTVVRRLVKYLPLTVEAMQGIAAADDLEFGKYSAEVVKPKRSALAAAMAEPEPAQALIDVEPEGPTADADGQLTDDGKEPPDDWRPGGGDDGDL